MEDKTITHNAPLSVDEHTALQAFVESIDTELCFDGDYVDILKAEWRALKADRSYWKGRAERAERILSQVKEVVR